MLGSLESMQGRLLYVHGTDHWVAAIRALAVPASTPAAQLHGFRAGPAALRRNKYHRDTFYASGNEGKVAVLVWGRRKQSGLRWAG